MDVCEKSALERFWYDGRRAAFAQVKWEDSCTGLWKGPKPVLIQGRGCVYEALWLPEHLAQCVEQRTVSPDEIMADVASPEDQSEISEPMFLII